MKKGTKVHTVAHGGHKRLASHAMKQHHAATKKTARAGHLVAVHMKAHAGVQHHGKIKVGHGTKPTSHVVEYLAGVGTVRRGT